MARLVGAVRLCLATWARRDQEILPFGGGLKVNPDDIYTHTCACVYVERHTYMCMCVYIYMCVFTRMYVITHKVAVKFCKRHLNSRKNVSQTPEASRAAEAGGAID